MKSLEETKVLLEKYNQSHLLSFYNELNDNEKEDLLKQIESIDFELILGLFNNKDKYEKSDDVIEPIKYIDKLKLSSDEIEKYSKIGEQCIKNGEYAFATLAGGQGTRLGHPGPKGTFKLGINPDKSLFEIMCDSLKNARKEYGVYINWYIMTSRENNDDTVNFFEDNNYFGYPKEKVTFFIQGELPMVDENGKIILEQKGKIKLAADGHGGIFEAMYKNNIINDMKSKGIKWCFIGGIDNVLLKMVDPILVGVAISNNTLIASKSIVKASPNEKVGVFCKRNNKPSVIEYSEISDDMAHMCDENGELIYGESHILCNLFNIEALEKVGDIKLPIHIAHKKCSYIDELGIQVTPIAPNVYKFETFMFDAFNIFDDITVLRVLREEEFAPIKNKEGIDSPDTARWLYKQHWEIE